jgi:UDP-N-acetylmuramate dehydrogenase
LIAPAAREALAAALGASVQFDVPLARFTSLRIGGPADALATPADRVELARTLALCGELALPLQVLGNGFNTLVRDGGVDGVVLRLQRFRDLRRGEAGDVVAEAGVTHATLTRFCVLHGLAGLEFGAGIPGTVGGWVTMNAGVPEREVKDALRGVVLADGAGRVHCVPRSALPFRYRSAGLPEGAVVVAASFAVREADRADVESEVERHLAKRAGTQPLDIPSCGSVFKNPPGEFAGRLIEQAGLKGARVGGAEISPVHANFIVNRGGASAADVLALIELARTRVHEGSGVALEPEVRIVGRDAA